jgi:hypothetical protein
MSALNYISRRSSTFSLREINMWLDVLLAHSQSSRYVLFHLCLLQANSQNDNIGHTLGQKEGAGGGQSGT